MNFGGRREATEDLTRDGGAISAAHRRHGRSRPSRARVAGAVTALLVLLALAGCGSSSPPATNSAAGSQFVAEANGACRTAYAKVSALHPSNSGPETTAEIAANVPKLAVIAQAMLGRLTALTPPASEQAEYTKMLNAWRKEISTALVRGQAAKAGDSARAGEAKTQLLALANEFDTAATKVGLSVCAANP